MLAVVWLPTPGVIDVATSPDTTSGVAAAATAVSRYLDLSSSSSPVGSALAGQAAAGVATDTTVAAASKKGIVPLASLGSVGDRNHFK